MTRMKVNHFQALMSIQTLIASFQSIEFLYGEGRARNSLVTVLTENIILQCQFIN